jgi:hypothetical protein
MTEPTFFVLTALVGEPRHGYGIVGEVDALSGGRVQGQRVPDTLRGHPHDGILNDRSRRDTSRER